MLMPLLALLVIIAVAAIVRFVENETQVSVQEKTYQYAMDQKLEFDAGTTLLPGKYAIILETDGVRVDGDPTPVYSQEAEALYLARDAAWSDPMNGHQWKIPAFSRLELGERDCVMCTLGDNTIRLDGGLLSDCAGTWLFLDAVSLYVNGKTFDLPPLSFCSIAGAQARMYDYAEESLRTEEEVRTNLTVRAKRGYQVDLTTSIFTNIDGSFYLMSGNTSVLKSIEER